MFFQKQEDKSEFPLREGDSIENPEFQALLTGPVPGQAGLPVSDDKVFHRCFDEETGLLLDVAEKKKAVDRSGFLRERDCICQGADRNDNAFSGETVPSAVPHKV